MKKSKARRGLAGKKEKPSRLRQLMDLIRKTDAAYLKIRPFLRLAWVFYDYWQYQNNSQAKRSS